jgi:LytS/YehU family sensor histidine kinase
MVVVSMAIVIKLLKNKNELQEKNEQLMLEKQKAELNFLKAQMHPHFLFNTLNTLYSETIQESGKAQLVVLHLSQLLRFILDECSKPLIPLGHEIKVVKDYIGLEQLRHGERLVVKLVERDVDHRVLISPLIFLPFVENSFKHTLAHKRGRIHIDISISMKNDMVYFQVQNDVSIGHATIDHNREGKGLPNVVRQLDLLYNKQYVLNVEEKNEKFNVTLSFPVKAEFLYA